jgi:hypothetical protein
MESRARYVHVESHARWRTCEESCRKGRAVRMEKTHHSGWKTNGEFGKMEKPADIQGGWIVTQRVKQDRKASEDSSCIGRLAESKAEEELK